MITSFEFVVTFYYYSYQAHNLMLFPDDFVLNRKLTEKRKQINTLLMIGQAFIFCIFCVE